MRKYRRTARELEEAGDKAGQMRADGSQQCTCYTVSRLKAAEFAASELIAADYTARELKAAGYSADDRSEGGYNKRDLRAVL